MIERILIKFETSRLCKESTRMVSDRLIPPSFDLKTHLVHPPIHQPPTPDDNNVSLLLDRESFILKPNNFNTSWWLSYKIDYFVWGVPLYEHYADTSYRYPLDC